MKYEALTIPLLNWSPDGRGVRSQTNWRTRRGTGNEDNCYPEYTTPPSQWHKSHTIDPDEFKRTSITSNGCNRPPDAAEVATAPMNESIDNANLESSDQTAHKADNRNSRWWSREQVKTIRPCKSVETNWINLIELKHHSYNSMERDHQRKHLQWTQWSYPWMWHRESRQTPTNC